MVVESKEAKRARARPLHTVPNEIPKDLVDGIPEPCHSTLTNLYDLQADTYVLKNSVLPLSADQRFEILSCLDRPNGMKQVLVTVENDQAILEVYFFNKNYFDEIFTDASPPHAVFPIRGGHRLPAGPHEGQLKVIEVTQGTHPEEAVLELIAKPIGDYSAYTLSIDRDKDDGKYAQFDPLFSEINFKFRPGCFSIDCAPEAESYPEPKENPAIDYLAKDFDSFRHTMIAAMMERVPEWQSTSEADLDQVLIELFSAAADELSDYQDRVMNEPYLATARERVSVARLARLMDYHIHQGNQASTWLALEVDEGHVLKVPHNFAVWAGNQELSSSSILFLNREDREFLTLNGEDEDKEFLPLFSLELKYVSDLISGNVPLEVKDVFQDHGITLSTHVDVLVVDSVTWDIKDHDYGRTYRIIKIKKGLQVSVQHQLHHLLNRLELYTWSDSIPALDAGSTQADVKVPLENPSPDEEKRTAYTVQNFMCEGNAEYLLVQEWRNPGDGSKVGRDSEKRQLLKLLKGQEAAQAMQDPVTDAWFVRIRWEEEDKLKKRYCFTIDCADGKKRDVSLFHGNLLKVQHGWSRKTTFVSPGQASGNTCHVPFEKTEKWGTLCSLPEGPLAYKETTPGGEVPPESTLEVEIHTSEEDEKWEEVISLMNSTDSNEHFIVETDELGQSVIRFGNGENGKALPEDAEVSCWYQIGKGLDGNIGADTLQYCDLSSEYVKKIDPAMLALFDQTAFTSIKNCWNPFDVTNGRAPEPVEEIIRRAPEAYLFRQLRAVTLKDYENRAEELEDVSRASARYLWTGSWRTVQIAIDPVGTTTLSDASFRTIRSHLDAFRLIGEDLEIRPARYVPLEINVSLCIHPDYWNEYIRHILAQEFSDSYTSDGRKGFFHPDVWTFGQPLHTSEIIGRVQAVEGVDHVTDVSIRRWNEATPGKKGVVEVRPYEIILVKNDPDYMERGFIFFSVKGGRQ